MSDIQRFGSDEGGIFESESGRWVRYDDHAIFVADLAMLVRRLCARITGIKQTSGDEEMVAKALDYLRRKGL